MLPKSNFADSAELVVFAFLFSLLTLSEKNEHQHPKKTRYGISSNFVSYSDGCVFSTSFLVSGSLDNFLPDYMVWASSGTAEWAPRLYIIDELSVAYEVDVA